MRQNPKKIKLATNSNTLNAQSITLSPRAVVPKHFNCVVHLLNNDRCVARLFPKQMLFSNFSYEIRNSLLAVLKYKSI